MKKYLVGALAVLTIWLGLGASNASAAWQYRTVQRYDPYCGRYTVTTERFWVDDCGPRIQTLPAYSNYNAPYRSNYGSYGASWNNNSYRGNYGRDFDRDCDRNNNRGHNHRR